MGLSRYKEIWLVDFEFHQPDGERPEPVCMVAREFRSGATIRLDDAGLRRRSKAPFSTAADALFVAYYASAELGCFLVLGWAPPANVLDLYVEFSNRTNGLARP